MRTVAWIAVGIALFWTGGALRAEPTQEEVLPATQEGNTVKSVLDFTVLDIDGKPVHLREKFEGDVLLIVNVASKCGLTPQYAGLQRLYEKYKDQGFAVLGFPANQFNNQEPGTNEEIKQFCTLNYGVTFPMFSKIVVKGEGIHPLYRFLTQEQPNEKLRGEIEWNFAKFLIGRDGQVIARFHPRVTPDDPKLIQALEQALAAPRPERSSQPAEEESGA